MSRGLSGVETPAHPTSLYLGCALDELFAHAHPSLVFRSGDGAAAVSPCGADLPSKSRKF
jgi:hypothetical protein